MADLILGPVVDVTVSKVIEVASEQLKLALEWKDDFRRFCFILEMIRGVLLDADEKHVTGHSHLKPWLRELRSVVDEADDVLEEIDYENLRRQVAVQKPKWKRFGHFFASSNPLAFRLRMANRVKNLNIYLADINDWATRLGLQYKLARTGVSEPRGNQQTHSLLGFSDSSQVFGREEDVDQIVSLLTDSSNQETLSVISVVGMAGLGKTTLAKKVCANDKIREYFGENIMWVCVSEIFDVQRILGEMLESLTGSPCINKNRDTLLRKIGEELEKKEEKKEGKKGDTLLRKIGEGKIGEELEKKEENKEEKKEGKKELKKGDTLPRKTGEELEKKEEKKEGKKEEGKIFFLILDDVWNDKSEKWDDLRSCLMVLCKKLGNRVVVTTRDKNVASAMGSKYIHPLKPLEPDNCWSIIKQRAFGEDVVPAKLEKIGMDIAKKCGGVPLVANVVGGILCNKRDENEWSSVEEKINVLGSLEDQHRRIRDVLQLSFERLPKPALKQCFAFCSTFPKGSVIEKEKLIQLWMAEGYLQSSKESSMEDVGGKYFTYLLSSSLFQEEARDSFKNVKSCKIHGLIHDFAQSINCFETVIIEKEPCSNIPHHVRHLNLSFGKERLQIKLEDVAEKLQTLFSKQGFPSSLQVNFTKLRVLSVCDVDDADPLPSCFGNSKGLRYLDISGTPIRQLPKFIPKMYNLQTFRFTNCKFLKMPPKGIGHLMNLRHIYFDDEDRMPAHIGRLTSLQTLQKFFVGEKRGYKIEELGKLSQLRGRLEIYNLECVKDKSEAQSAKLLNKALDELQLSWEEEGNHDRDEDVLEGLQTPSNLQILGIQRYGGGKLPLWMLESHGESFLLKNLVELNIDKCQKLKSIPLLKGFSSLRRLRIRECSELSTIDGGAFEFPSLEELFICLCCKLESVPVSGLTSLQTLEIVQCMLMSSIGDSLSTSKCLKRLLISCSNLKSVPSLDGLTSLKGLEIAQCDKLEHLPSGLSSCTALEELSIWGCKNLESTCSNLESIPSLDGLSSLKRLEIVQCDELKHLPSGLSSCTALEELSIWGCKNLESIPEELKKLHSLVKLHISRCEQLMSFPKECLGCLDHLKSLFIGGFSEEMEKLPDLSVINASLEELTLGDWKPSDLLHQIQHLTALRELTICGSFKEFEALSHGLEKLSSLTKLCISSCQDQISLTGGLNKLLHLTALEFSFCDGLISLPEELKELPQLKKLEIANCDNLISLPEDLKELHSLVEFQISQCSNLRSFPDEILPCLTSLKRLEIGGFSEGLQEFPGLRSIHGDLKLEELELDGWDKLTQLPPQIQSLTALKELSIWFFEQVVTLPEWVKEFTSLQRLEICCCNNMKQLPPMEVIQGLSKLQVLDIYNCPKLKKRCAKKRGSEWSKISHIREVIFSAD